jgi:hypothetical protein
MIKTPYDLLQGAIFYVDVLVTLRKDLLNESKRI